MPFSSVDLKYFYVIILYFRFRYWWCLGHIIYHFRFRVMLSSFTGHLYHVSFSANQTAPTSPHEGTVFDNLPSKQQRLHDKIVLRRVRKIIRSSVRQSVVCGRFPPALEHNQHRYQGTVTHCPRPPPLAGYFGEPQSSVFNQ